MRIYSAHTRTGEVFGRGRIISKGFAEMQSLLLCYQTKEKAHQRRLSIRIEKKPENQEAQEAIS